MRVRNLSLLTVKSTIKPVAPFVISAVVAYRLLEIDIEMDLGVESAAVLGS